jgi:hypothetical protein
MADLTLVVTEQGVEETQRKLQSLQGTVQQTAQTTNRWGGATNAASKGMNRMGVVTQQAGYQVGDFLVQIQSGTNAFVAFGQQATQLVGVLPMLDKKFLGLSAILGIAIPLVTAVAAALMRTREEAEDTSGIIDRLETSVNNYQKAVEILNLSQDDLTESFGRFSEVARQVNEELRARSLREISAEIQNFANSVIPVEEVFRVIPSYISVTIRDFLNLSDSINRSQEEIVGFYNAVVNLNRAEGIDSQVEAAQNLLDTLDSITESQGELTASQKEFRDNLVDLLKVLVDLGGETEAMGQTMRSMFSDVLDDFGNLLPAAQLLPPLVGKAAEEAENLAEQKQVSLDKAQLLVDKMREFEQATKDATTQVSLLNNRMTDAAGAIFSDLYDENGNIRTGAELLPTFDPDKGSSSGRGRATQTIDEIIAARQKQLDLEQELLGLNRERATARRIEFELENEYQGTITETMREQIQAAAESMAAQEEQIRKIEELRERNQAVADSIADNFGKALTSVVDGTKSVKDAFKDMARAIIADLYQMYVVKQITGFISDTVFGAIGGGGAKPPKFASGGYMMANQPALVGENGPELIMPSRQSTVMNADLTAKALGGGESVNVTQVFNINGNGDEYIMGKIAQAAPRIADATKKSILDERRRGGVYKSVFG